MKKYFPIGASLFRRGQEWLRAVDDVSFILPAGETLGLVGESGCGKTTLGRCILRLVEPTAGRVLFRKTEGGRTACHSIPDLGAKRLRLLRRHMQMIFQNPYLSLDPRMTIGATLDEGLKVHGLGNRDERRLAMGRMLERVGLSPHDLKKYPHAFSGGQRQRIAIARALSVNPAFVVCDEPVSALDVSVQAQIVNLLLDLQAELKLTYLFISHDLGLVSHVSQRVAVMYKGQIVELAASKELYQSPAHPYTRQLLSGKPAVKTSPPDNRQHVPGVSLCRFRMDCPDAVAECSRSEPALIQLGSGRQVRCHLSKEVSPPAQDSTPQ